MNLTHYEPWNLLSDLQRDINRVFTDRASADTSAATAGWVPAVDINEYEDRFALFVDLPGVEPNDVEITLEHNVLTLTGERTSATGQQDNEQAIKRRIERGDGRFYRRFVLPDTVDAEKVKATGRHGVLEVTIPKQAKALPRRIKVAA